jgi:hypothetical protein
MEFPTEDWDVFEAGEFEQAAPRGTGETVLELMVQLRPNGRIQDHFRAALAGNKIYRASVWMSNILPIKDLYKLQFSFDFWVKDLIICRNMSTSLWMDLYEEIQKENSKKQKKSVENIRDFNLKGKFFLRS